MTDSPTPLQLTRALVVVAGGPLALAVGSLVAPVAAARRWPDRARRPALRRTAWAATVAGLAAPLAYGLLVRPWMLRWGSTREERERSWPGDADDRPLSTTTRAVTVHAPAEEVWRWLAQIGQDRGGFYSYDWLENLAGCRLRSAERIHPEWQRVDAGDPLTLFPGYATRLAEVDPPHALVIENWGAYVVVPDGAGSCRLVARSHVDRGPAAAAYLLGVELPHFVMERRMLLGIKRRAEEPPLL